MKDNIVISSRVRLARNYDDICFLPKMGFQDAITVKNRIVASLINAPSLELYNMKLLDMETLSDAQKSVLVEKHLISPDLKMRGAGSGIVLSADESVSVMINEEDHIRIQVIKKGYDLQNSLDTANKIDDILEAGAKYAFDEKYGYKTVCPTNMGTGQRASLMMHLPALSLANQLSGLIVQLSKFGITFRGIYGEGSLSTGNIYQISNQITLGVTEQETVDKLSAAANQLIDREMEVTQAFSDNIALTDKIFRSFGLLQNARLLSSDEFMNLISDVRLGINMGIIENIDPVILNEAIAEAQSAGIGQMLSENTPQNRDIKRAEIIRKIFANN